MKRFVMNADKWSSSGDPGCTISRHLHIFYQVSSQLLPTTAPFAVPLANSLDSRLRQGKHANPIRKAILRKLGATFRTAQTAYASSANMPTGTSIHGASMSITIPSGETMGCSSRSAGLILSWCTFAVGSILEGGSL